MYLITKSEKFKPGVCSIRSKMGDKKRSVAFEKGDSIKVTEDEYKAINNWYIIDFTTYSCSSNKEL